MTPQTQPPKKANSSRVNLTISVAVHIVIILALVYFAAREGYLGKKIQTITITKIEEKHKEPEKPREPEKPKVEPPKVEPPRAEVHPAEPPKPVAPATVAPPVTAPPPGEVASLEFEGGKAVNSESDPIQLYKGYLEYLLRSNWKRPQNMADDDYTAEVQIQVDRSGNLGQTTWLKGSGDDRWDQSVKDVFKVVAHVDRPPPTNFPSAVTIRFDVEAEAQPILTQ